MLATNEHLRVLYELYHTAVEEEINLRQELDYYKRMAGDFYED